MTPPSDAPSLAIIAALPRELAALVAGWERLPATPAGVLAFRGPHAVAVSAGIGAERATLAVNVALTHGRVRRLLSVGLAGACDPALRAATVVRCFSVVDVRSGERYRCETQRSGAVLATTTHIVSVAEKHRLRDSYGASLVDMEAATVARLARAHDLSFDAIKVVSDEAEFAMDAMDRFISRAGSFREGAFAAHVALRPRLWQSAVTLGRNSRRALRALTGALQIETDADQVTAHQATH